MDPSKPKIQTAKDYKLPKITSKELVQLSQPTTPTKTPSQRPSGPFPPLTSNFNKFSPLQNLPELPYKSVCKRKGHKYCSRVAPLKKVDEKTSVRDDVGATTVLWQKYIDYTVHQQRENEKKYEAIDRHYRGAFHESRLLSLD
ncbi:hypothetical protein F511_45059 [Dorcoceras hygrometricum]|uniref:Uncharacterized protein n=1 Tax=Dorcoceras hygrometricum TaxID=472368 RepID=A0A2Z7C1D3_9LAMI|nr:hypothetical protein F511_45059 [Dorcoceras hygrometricum]